MEDRKLRQEKYFVAIVFSYLVVPKMIVPFTISNIYPLKTILKKHQSIMLNESKFQRYTANPNPVGLTGNYR